jgi:hypothetical protein
MAPIKPPLASASDDPAPTSVDWPVFAQRLAHVLGALQEDQYLIVLLKGTNRYLQFAGQGQRGLLAQCIGNEYLGGAERLDDRQLVRLQELGWRGPPDPAPESTPECDTDGSPNHFVAWPAQAPVADLADLAVRTLVEVLGVAHPGVLEYDAFDVQRRAIVFAHLGLQRFARPTDAEFVARIRQRLLAAVQEATGLDGLTCDEGQDVHFFHGSTVLLIGLDEKRLGVRMRALMVTDVEPSPALHERLNELNVGLTSMHVLHHRGTIQAVCEVPALPFVPKQVTRALDGLCQVCGGLVEMLQAEFGGRLLVGESMPSVARH